MTKLDKCESEFVCLLYFNSLTTLSIIIKLAITTNLCPSFYAQQAVAHKKKDIEYLLF